MEQIIGGRCEVEERLGRGYYGAVYRARDPRVGRLVAVKVLNANVSEEPGVRARFVREAKVMGGLDHPAIVTVHDFGEDHGEFYLVMRHFGGGTLLDLLSARFTFGRRLDNLTLDGLDRVVCALWEARGERKAGFLRDLNLQLEVLRCLWRLVEQRGWIGPAQLLFVVDDSAKRVVDDAVAEGRRRDCAAFRGEDLEEARRPRHGSARRASPRGGRGIPTRRAEETPARPAGASCRAPRGGPRRARWAEWRLRRASSPNRIGRRGPESSASRAAPR